MSKTDRIQIAIGVAGLVISGLYLFERHAPTPSSASAPLPEASATPASSGIGVAGGGGGGGGAGGAGGANLVAPETGQQTTSATEPPPPLTPQGKVPGQGLRNSPGHALPMARVASTQPIR